MTTLIAELGSNHNGDFGRACALVDAAAECGFTAVKLQLYRPEALFCAEALARDPALREKPLLSVDWLDPLIDRAHANGLKIGVTPFDLGAVDVLSSRQVDFIKIASYSLLHTKLIAAVGLLRKPVMISTGMSTQAELERAMNTLLASYVPPVVTLLHCTSSYPTDPIEADLNRIVHLNSIADLWNRVVGPVGYSDHTRDADVVCAAVHVHGARVVELHFDLDGEGDEARHGHCWLPEHVDDLHYKLAKVGKALAPRVSRTDDAERVWRTDPRDGLRPMMSLREKWLLTSQA